MIPTSNIVSIFLVPYYSQRVSKIGHSKMTGVLLNQQMLKEHVWDIPYWALGNALDY